MGSRQQEIARGLVAAVAFDAVVGDVLADPSERFARTSGADDVVSKDGFRVEVARCPCAS